MSKTKPAYRIPFQNNTMLEYTSYTDGEISLGQLGGWISPDGVTEWRDNVEFDACVRLKSHGRGRSSVRVYVEIVRPSGDQGSTAAESFSMSISAFYEACVLFGVDDAMIAGRWCFRKQGSNYTLWPVKPGE